MDNWAPLITIFGLIATWLTIVLVYFTLREMRNQRIASQKPDLIIPKSPLIRTFSFRKEGESNLLIPRNWSFIESSKDKIKDWLESVPVKFYNVGFGAAKNIKLKWIVEYDMTLQKIKDYCYRHSVPIVLQIEESNLNILERGEVRLMNHSLSPEVREYEFLMPVTVTKEALMSFAPHVVKELVSIIMYLDGHHLENYQDGRPELLIDVPPIRLEIEYDDVEDTHYSKRFDVVLKFGYRILEEERIVVGLEHFTDMFIEFKSINRHLFRRGLRIL